MAKLLKLRRGTTTQHGSFTGAEGEVTVDTDKETLVVHDGSTAGGTPLAKESAIPDVSTKADLSGATFTGNVSLGANDLTVGDIRSKVPTGFWNSSFSYFRIADYGHLTSDGGYQVNITAGGYRDTSGWVDTTVNSQSGFGCQIGLNPTNGHIQLNSESGKSTGDTHVVAQKMLLTPTKVFVTAGVAGERIIVSALDIDCNEANYFTKTINANSTFTFSNPASAGYETSFTLELTHTSGTVTWPASVKWNADTAPTLTTGKTHLFMFVTDDGGTRWRGSALVDYVN